MERVNSHLDVLKNELNWYANTIGYQSTAYLFCDEDKQKYVVVTVDDYDSPNTNKVEIMMMVHIDSEYIVVDADNTDKPLYKGLMHAGIPREKIILAYAGERVPTTQPE
jgi:hypothetical protein